MDLPETFYAPAARASETALRKAVAVASHNPVIDTVMRAFGGLVAVLNENRQILAVNSALLQALGIEDAQEALGLRPGEALGCVRAHAHPGGCGTSRYCSNCGAAIAMVTALKSGAPEERECALTVRRNGKTMDLDFAVRCCPIDMEGLPLLLLFMREVSEERRRGALERTFFHDLNNLLTGLDMSADLLADSQPEDEMVRNIRQSIGLLLKEVELQRVLARAAPDECALSPQEASVHGILERLRVIYATHPAAKGKVLHVVKPPGDARLTTDLCLLLRVLMNMVTNALEATEAGDEVRVSTAVDRGAVTFLVWNRQAIPADVALRVFQRYFTTKAGIGRGLGTFAMKLLAERYLKGEVGFTSTEAEGTTFSLRLCGPSLLDLPPRRLRQEQ